MNNFWIVFKLKFLSTQKLQEKWIRTIYIYIYILKKSNKNFIEKIIRLLFFILQIDIIYLLIYHVYTCIIVGDLYELCM